MSSQPDNTGEPGRPPDEGSGPPSDQESLADGPSFARPGPPGGEAAEPGEAAADPPPASGDEQTGDEQTGGEQTGGEEQDEAARRDWYILKVQVNREQSIRDALQRRVKLEGLEEYFGDIIVPTEDVAEFTKTGKRRVVKRKLYPGYIVVHMTINDDTWFAVRETPGIGDFTGAAGKPTPMAQHEVDRILAATYKTETGDTQVKTAIPFRAGDQVRVKEGYFQNFEGEVESVDEANGRVTVMINIFGRSTPVELEHWQIEPV